MMSNEIPSQASMLMLVAKNNLKETEKEGDPLQNKKK